MITATKSKTPQSLFHGVHYASLHELRWQANIKRNGRKRTQSFATEQQAIQQRLEWEKEFKLYGTNHSYRHNHRIIQKMWANNQQAVKNLLGADFDLYVEDE